MTATPTAREQFATHPATVLHARHINPAFVDLLQVWGYGRVFTHADGVWLTDDRGQRYLDALSGYGSVSLGHYHPRLKARMVDFLERQPLNLCLTGVVPEAAHLARRLAQLVPGLDVVLFSSSGGEAVDAALKLARAATKRSRIVYCHGGFHGTGIGNLSVMGKPRWQLPFAPLLPECVALPFGDLGALDKALKGKRSALFLVEPTQVEGGLHTAPPGYLAAAAALCQRYGTLLAIDEVQTGLCRTGRMLALEHHGVVPDMVVLGKGLGSGVTPIAATLVSADLQRRAYGSRKRFDLHGTTYAGNGLACAIADETLQTMHDEGLAQRAAERGTQLQERLKRSLAGHPWVQDIRGQGLLVAVQLGGNAESSQGVQGWLQRLVPGALAQFSQETLGQWVALRLLEAGVVCQPCSHDWRILRLEPPLVISPAEVDELARRVHLALDDCRAFGPVAKAIARRMRDQKPQQQALHQALQQPKNVP